MDSEPQSAEPRSGSGAAEVRRAGAFVADPETMLAVQAGLPEWEVEAHDGDIRTAISVLAGDASKQLILVDLDGVPYPAGSIHELAAVCQVGTTVVALGSQDSARFSRDVLATGIADYLIKPITPDRLREVVLGAVASGSGPDGGGRSVAFAGTGGSGASTLLAATAISAAARGRYVAVLDLNRAFSAVPFMLDVEPAPGLDELLEAAAAGTPDPELVEAARVSHSDRISVFAYRWNPLLAPPASHKSIRLLLADLRRRFHLVLVDPEPSGRIPALRDCDRPVLVTEPTRNGALRSARAFAGLGSGAAVVHVGNRTRPLRRSAIAKAAGAARASQEPDIQVPFDGTLPELSDRGELYARFPRKLRQPMDRLIDLLSTAPADRLPAAAPAA